MINDANVVTGKRERKPKDMFLPEKYQSTRQPRSTDNAPRRNRNKAVDSTKLNRWQNYYSLVKRALVSLTKELHYVDVYTQQQKANVDPRDPQMLRFNAKILQYKQVIHSTLAALDGENNNHKQWPELAEADENDMVDVDNVYCSVCNLEESDNNDILFCDRTGCLRAYHQFCLDPPVTLASFDPDQDWFCWKCECMDDCLEIVEEKLDLNVKSYEELFPELKEQQELKKRDTLFSSELADDDDDNEDEDDEFEPVLEEKDDDELDSASASASASNVGSDSNEGYEQTESNDNDKEGNEQKGDESLLRQLQSLKEHSNRASDDDDDDDKEEEVPLSDLGSDLDEDEITNLLHEANTDADTSSLLPTTSNSRYNLRDRSTYNKALTLDDMIIHHSDADINRPIAIIRRGVFILGTITHYDNNDSVSGKWTLNYNSSGQNSYKYKEIITSDVTTVQQALLRYHEYTTLQSQRATRNEMQEKITQLVRRSGVLSDANIVSGPRRKETVNYVQLSMQMFGSLVDDDDIGAEDDDYFEKQVEAGRSRRRSGGNKRSSKATASSDNDEDNEDDAEEDGEEDEASGEEYDPRADPANKNKRKRRRPSKGSTKASGSSSSSAQKKGRGRGPPRKITVGSDDDDQDEEVNDEGRGEDKKVDGEGNGHRNKRAKGSNGKRRNPPRTSRSPIKSYAPPATSSEEDEEEGNGEDETEQAEVLDVDAADGEVLVAVFDEEEDMDVVQEEN